MDSDRREEGTILVRQGWLDSGEGQYLVTGGAGRLHHARAGLAGRLQGGSRSLKGLQHAAPYQMYCKACEQWIQDFGPKLLVKN